VHRADDDVCEAGECFAGLLGRHRAGEDTRADQEHLLLAELARRIEQILVGARLRERVRHLGGELVGVGQRAEEGRLDQRIHDLGMHCQNVGKPRRRPEREREQRHQVGVA